MSDFSASDAGLIGFRLTRQHPSALISWSILGVAMGLIGSLLLAQFAGPALAEVANANPFEPLSEAQAQERLRMFAGLWPVALLILPLGLVMSGVLAASINRIVLTPDDSATGYLRFGPAEVRQIIVAVLLMLIELGVMIAGFVAILVVGTVASLASPALGGIVVALGFLAVIGLFIWVRVRLSLLASLAFDTGKIVLGDAWHMTEGRFWPMFGAYLIALIMAVIVNLLGSAIFMGVAGVFFGASQPMPTSVAAVFTPLNLIFLVFNAVVTTLFQLILLGAAPSIYQQIRGRIETFD